VDVPVDDVQAVSAGVLGRHFYVHLDEFHRHCDRYKNREAILANLR
jgi:hypothetical protein